MGPLAHAEKLDVLDLSFLWPMPQNAKMAENLISLADAGADGNLMSDELFNQLIAMAKTVPAGGQNIGFTGEVEANKRAWKVAGIRINPVSISSHPSVTAVTNGKPGGEVPSLRLIVQPVTADGADAQFHDTAMHVVFTYLKGKNGDTFLPDREAYQALVNDLQALKADLRKAGVDTSGKRLGIHSGFGNGAFDLTKRLRELLSKHCSKAKLGGLSFMGVPVAFEPWTFFPVDLTKTPPARKAISGNVPADTKHQVMNFLSADKVQPGPNLDPSAPQKAFGLSTALLFKSAVDVNKVLFPATHPFLPNARVKDVDDLIANPALPFFHTGTVDCASCHSETTRRLSVQGLAEPSPFAFKQPAGISEVDPQMLRANQWNVRDFGWGAEFEGGEITFHPTITQRAANEAADSADFTNKNYPVP